MRFLLPCVWTLLTLHIGFVESQTCSYDSSTGLTIIVTCPPVYYYEIENIFCCGGNTYKYCCSTPPEPTSQSTNVPAIFITFGIIGAVVMGILVYSWAEWSSQSCSRGYTNRDAEVYRLSTNANFVQVHPLSPQIEPTPLFVTFPRTMDSTVVADDPPPYEVAIISSQKPRF